MGARREGREAAMQFLFLNDLGGAETPSALEEFFRLRDASYSARKFCRSLVTGVLERQADIDALIVRFCENYAITRLAVVDRNILRVAIYEMTGTEEVPPVVAINEAIEIAKKYGSDESGRFVNGILDRVRSTLNRPPRSPSSPRPPTATPRTARPQ